jgi:hypothetical protein
VEVASRLNGAGAGKKRSFRVNEVTAAVVTRPGVIYGFNIRDHHTGETRIDYVGRTSQPIEVREQQHRGRLPVFGALTGEQPWADLIVGSAIVIESGRWSLEELSRREVFHIHRLRPRYNVVGNEHNPVRIKRRDATRMRDERDPRGSGWRYSPDADLVARLVAGGFRGPEYRRFVDELTSGSVGLLTEWVVSGNILALSAGRGLPLPRPATPIDYDTATELAGETVARALPVFLEKRLRRWDPVSGKSLLLYFTSGCIYHYANVFRSWLLGETRRLRDLLVDDLSLLDVPVCADFADDVGVREVAELSLSRLTLVDRHMAVLTAAGWKQSEIATRFGFTERKVERTLANRRAGIGWAPSAPVHPPPGP